MLARGIPLWLTLAWCLGHPVAAVKASKLAKRAEAEQRAGLKAGGPMPERVGPETKAAKTALAKAPLGPSGGLAGSDDDAWEGPSTEAVKRSPDHALDRAFPFLPFGGPRIGRVASCSHVRDTLRVTNKVRKAPPCASLAPQGGETAPLSCPHPTTFHAPRKTFRAKP